MKNDYIQDERILSERRKIQSRAYGWIITILLVSVIVQQFVLVAPFSQYAVEFFLLIGCGLYNVVANYIKGIDIWNPRGDSKKQILFSALVTGGFSVTLFAILSSYFQIKNLAIFFVVFVVLFFLTRLIMVGITKKKQDRIDKEINDDDMTD